MAVSHSLPNLARFVRQNQFATVVAGLVALGAVSGLYGEVAERGWMGAEEKAKYEAQSSSEIGLLGGRAEFLGSLAAIADSPLIGHGSWARDRKGYGFRLVAATGGGRGEVRLRAASIAAGTALIPCHSHLWQGWVWHGLLGGLFWVVVAAMMLAYLRRALGLVRPIRGYALLLMLTSSWALLFSPFSSRPRWAVVFCLCALSLGYLRRQGVQAGIEEGRVEDWDGTWPTHTEA